MTFPADLVLDAPDPAHGRPAAGAWRLVVEIMAPASALDPSSPLTWHDVTGPILGLDHDTGAAPFGDHPSPASLTLEVQCDRWRRAPWAPPELDGHLWTAGRTIRYGWHNTDTDTWRPEFTGEISDVAPTSRNVDADVTMIVQADDPMVPLAGVQLFDAALDPGSLSSAVEALLVDYGWQNGVVLGVPAPPSSPTIFPAVMTGVRFFGNLAETLRRLADAWALTCYTLPDGRLAFVRRRPDLAEFGVDDDPLADLDDAITIDTTTIDTDTTRITFALADLVNTMTIRRYVQTGIFGPATVQGTSPTIPERISTAVVGSRLHTGAPTVSVSGGIPESSAGHRRLDTTSSNASSIATYRERRREFADPVEIGLAWLIMPTVADRTVELRADDLWTIRGLRLDDRNMADLVELRHGRAVIVEHSTPTAQYATTFAGRLHRKRVRAAPLNPSAVAITVDVDVDAFSSTTTPLYDEIRLGADRLVVNPDHLLTIGT